MNLIILCVFAVVVFCSCLFTAYFGRKWNLKPLLAISSGVLLAICFLEFLPHSFEHHDSHKTVSFFILVGVLIQAVADIYLLPHLKFLDKLIKVEDSQLVHQHSHTLSPFSVCSVTGCLTICSFFDGIRLFSALNMEKWTAILTAVALFFHLLSEGVLLAVLALSSGIKNRVLIILVFCVMGALILGAVFAQIFFISFSLDGLLAFSSGILIYICFVHLLPLCLKQKNNIWFFTGLILFSLIYFFV